MNGRALNEKAIEVSPSSSRVLDRAAEILTPFPPSKNRPRPGDWTCPSCGFSNFQRRTACFRCSYPAVSSGHGGDPMYPPYGYGAPHMMQPHHHMGHHGGHGMGGGHGRGMGGGSGMVPFRAGDWKCGSDGCGYHNFAKNVSCLRCGASRAGAAVVADSSFTSPMDPPAGYGLGPPSMAGTPGPGFAPSAGGYASTAFGGSTYGGPASTYLPAGLNPAGPWQPMNPGFSAGSGHSAGAFDSRATEAAFASVGNNGPASGAPSNGALYSAQYGGLDNANDPFSFLNSEMNNLSMADSNRRNGANSNKSPA